MEYSKHHRQIVEDLMSGKFILATDKIFFEIKENESFYSSFFKASFGYELNIKQDFAYLISEETNEMLSRDISIFFAILCYELDKAGKNFMDLVQYSEFEFEDVERYFENSAYKDVVEANKQLDSKEKRRNFINVLNRRNIVEKNGDDRFSFTPAYKVFFDFAEELISSRSTEVSQD
jgi:hypothetical protein